MMNIGLLSEHMLEFHHFVKDFKDKMLKESTAHSRKTALGNTQKKKGGQGYKYYKITFEVNRLPALISTYGHT